MDPDVFDAAGVDVAWQDFSFPEYEQLFPEQGFVPDLSIVDTLLCCGFDAKAFLEPMLRGSGPVLVVAPHPDDEVLGPGATIAPGPRAATSSS